MTQSNPDRQKIARQFIGAIPQCKALRISLDVVEFGEATLNMPYNDELVGDPTTGVIHGGAVSTLMDTCCGTAVMSHPEGPVATATIDLRIDYMRPATPGQTIVAVATCYHITRTVAFVRATAVDNDRTRPVATATGAFTVERAS